jgi:hypothetical protein
MAYDKDRWRASVQNGRIPAALLDRIEPPQHDPDLGGPAVMHPEAARAMSALLGEAPAGLAVKYSYRTLAKQTEKYAAWKNGSGNLAAFPGTSNHGWAVAVDLTNLSPTILAWLNTNARRFGYVFDVPGEPWHAVYYGGWTPPKGDEETVNLDKYLEGEAKFRERYKERGDKDPGPPPMGDKYAKAGWNAARFAANNPKAKK